MLLLKWHDFLKKNYWREEIVTRNTSEDTIQSLIQTIQVPCTSQEVLQKCHKILLCHHGRLPHGYALSIEGQIQLPVHQGQVSFAVLPQLAWESEKVLGHFKVGGGWAHVWHSQGDGSRIWLLGWVLTLSQLAQPSTRLLFGATFLGSTGPNSPTQTAAMLPQIRK